MKNRLNRFFRLERETKKSLLLFVSLFLFSYTAMAQQNVTGRVIDAEDREPLARAMALVKRTEGGSLVKYVATDEEGNFNLSLSSEEMATCMLHVTMMGYKPQMLPFSTEPMIIALPPAATELKEVIVKARKISSEGDTVRYHVASFADKQDRTIGDVMQKMPGIEVSQTGKIQYNGSDILRFYVEGKDLLGGKYNIATQGISPDDVGSVEILENHQPLRILQQVVSSSQASINLRLKEHAKSRWLVNLLAVGGLSEQPQGGLWSGELFGMNMGAKSQHISLYKSNNTGKDLEKEVIDFSSSSLEQLDSYLTMGKLSSAGLEKKRIQFNRSHLFSSSHLWSIKNESELKLQVDYLNNSEEAQSSMIRTYYLQEGERVVVEERSAEEQRHKLSARVGLEVNKATFYIKDQLKVEGAWCDEELFTAGTIQNRQKASLPEFRISNAFQLMKRVKGNIFTFTSNNAYQSLPHTLQVEQANHYRQEVKESLFSSEQLGSYGFKLNRFYLSLEAGVSAQIRNMNSQLEGFPNTLDSLTNNASTYYVKMGIAPKLEYGYRKLEVTLESPLNYYHYRWREERESYPIALWAPSLRVKWKINPYLYATLRGRVSSDVPSMHQLYNSWLLTDYRTLTKGYSQPFPTTGQSVSLSLNYRNALLSGIFAYITLSRNWNSSDYMMNQEFEGDYIFQTQVEAPFNSDAWNVIGNVSCNVGFLRGVASLNFLYRNSRSAMLSESDLQRFRNETYQLNGKLSGRIFTFMNWQYALSYGQQDLNIEGLYQQSRANWKQTFSLAALPIDALRLQVGGEYYQNQLTATENKYLLLLDAKASYQLNKKLELTATCTNLFNDKSYAYTYTQNLSSVDYVRSIRGREVLVGIYCKF